MNVQINKYIAPPPGLTSSSEALPASTAALRIAIPMRCPCTQSCRTVRSIPLAVLCQSTTTTTPNIHSTLYTVCYWRGGSGGMIPKRITMSRNNSVIGATEKNPNQNWAPFSQIFPSTWLVSALSCLVLARNVQRNPDTKTINDWNTLYLQYMYFANHHAYLITLIKY